MFLWAICLGTASAAVLPCPRTIPQGDAWLNRSIDSIVRSAYAAYLNELAEDRHQRVVDGVANTIQRCKIGDNTELSKRFPEFFKYVKLLSLAGREDHELGFEVSDKQYFAETSQFTTIPDYLVTPAFLRAVSSWETLATAKSLLREMNQARGPSDRLLFFSYASRHLGTPDNPDSFRRLLIVVPGDSTRGVPEKWVQFGIADPRRPRTVRNVSVVSVMRSADEASKVYFKDYFRAYRRNGSITIKGRWEMGEGDDPCVSCHKSGVLPVFPVAGSVSTDEKPTLDAVNERFRGYGVARFGRYVDLSKFGPGLGSPTPSSAAATAEFKTRACTACHNTNGLGAFNWPMDSTLIKSFVTGGRMPLNANLPSAARTQLYKKLVTQYFSIDETRPGILKAWLLGRIRSTNDGGFEATTK
jgi:hypothetical protein